MALFAISDLHLSLMCNKPMDIFKGWQDYVDRIHKNWQAVVGPDDTVVIGGDISWAMRLSELDADFEFINSLNGRKIIVKGNHDLWWETVSKMNRYLDQKGFDSITFLHNNFYESNGVAVCGTRGWFYDEKGEKKILHREAQRLETSIKLGKESGCEPVVFLHYPPVFCDWNCKEIIDVLKQNEIKRVFYGHIHGSGAQSAINGLHEGIEYRLMSCDCNNFTPILVAK